MVSAISAFFAGDATEYESSVILLVNAGKNTLQAVRQQGLHLQNSIRLKSLDLTVTPVAIPTGEDPVSILDKLKKKGVGKIMLNHFYQLEGKNRQQHVTPDYPNTLINWSIPCRKCGTGLKIGLVDSYVDAHVEPLQSQRLVRRSFAKGAKTSNLDHGTAIATMLVGCHDRKFCGLMPNAVLYAAGAFSENTSNDPRATTLAIVKSLNWLLAEKTDIINLSFSGPNNELLRMAITKIAAKKIPIIAAAGNHGADAPPAYPAAYPEVIAVTAVDQFHHRYARANQGDYISFAAPGVRVPVPCNNDQLCLKTGTSYAVPYCTALVASQLRPSRKRKSLRAIIKQLKHNVIDLGPSGKDGVYGWGLVQCGRRCGNK